MTDQQTSDLGVAGVPQDAIKRLAELQPGKAGSIFTSDLSVNEFLLVREAGFRPLGLVLGSSIYHVGLQVGRWGRNQELDVLSQAMYHARELAMSRMEAEADALKADGIVGVRLDVEMKEFGADIAEFIAVGTAVKAEPDAGGGGVTNWRNNKKQPFTSDLSGQDFWTLIRAGYAPLGMVMGTCVYHIAHQRMGSVIGNIGGTSRSSSSPRRCTTRGSWPCPACRRKPRRCTPRASSASSCGSTATRGGRTRQNSSRSARPSGRCATTTSSSARRWSSPSTPNPRRLRGCPGLGVRTAYRVQQAGQALAQAAPARRIALACGGRH